MSKERYIAAIDIGSFAMRVVQMKLSPAAGLLGATIVGAVSVPASGLRRGVIVDTEEAVSALSAALEKLERMTAVPVTAAVVSVGGYHLTSLVSKGVIAVSKADGEVGESDVARVIDASEAVSMPPNREVIHVVPRVFSLDGQEGVLDPIGMKGVRLEVETTIVHGSAPLVRNLQKTLTQAGVEILEMVSSPLAAAEAVLTKKQRELGVAVMDIGGATTSLAVYDEGQLLKIAVIPLGGIHITNDLAIGLRTSIETAERVKLLHGYAYACPGVNLHQVVDLAKIDDQETDKRTRGEIVEIIEARLEEILGFVDKELKSIGKSGKLPAGVVVTGGASNMAGVAEFVKERLRLPAQIGIVRDINTIIDKVDDPSFAAACGLLLWQLSAGTAASAGQDKLWWSHPKAEQLKSWFRSFMP